MILTVKVQQYEWFSFSIETFFPCSLFVGCWFFSQYHIGAILKFLKEFFRSLDKARVLGRVHWRRKNFLWDIRSCKIVISANTVLSQTRARTAQPMTLSVTDWLYRLSDFWFQRHRHICVLSDDWSEKWGDMAWTKWRQKKRHWERFSGFVTIPDKLRNANQVIEGQWLTVRVSESQRDTWTAFVIFAMFSLYYLLFSLQFSPIFTFTSSFPQSGRREMILKTNQSQKKVKGTKVQRYEDTYIFHYLNQTTTI